MPSTLRSLHCILREVEATLDRSSGTQEADGKLQDLIQNLSNQQVDMKIAAEGAKAAKAAVVAQRPENTMRAAHDQLNKKIQDDEKFGQMVNVTLKSSAAAKQANKLTLAALDLVNRQCKCELAQSQTQLELDSQVARNTLTLQWEELAAATTCKGKKDGQIDELKSSISNVQGTLAEMGLVSKLLLEQLPSSSGSY
ncbi:hypothetical protein DFH28DRAFT_927634 [Melampsora americana]|nr:hypothetical protein DFH28DRAFT_927634 [Melampsora americana]